MRVFVEKNETTDDGYLPVHGVDYHKGLKPGQTCGVAHEFRTRNCIPVFYTQEEVERSTFGEFVELVPFRTS